MLQRLPIALAQVKAGNTSEHLLNEIRQIIYSLYQENKVTKKVYNNIMNPINLFSGNRLLHPITYRLLYIDSHRILVNLSHKTNLKRSNKYVASAKIINLKYQLRHSMKSLNYLMDHILYQIFKNILSIY